MSRILINAKVLNFLFSSQVRHGEVCVWTKEPGVKSFKLKSFTTASASSNSSSDVPDTDTAQQ